MPRSPAVEPDASTWENEAVTSSDLPEPTATAAPTPSSAPTTLKGLLGRILRQVAVVTVAVTVIGAIIGLATQGSAGLWGALLGGVVGVIFCISTVVTMLISEGRSPQFLAAVVLGGWLAKMLVIIVMLAILRDLTFYDKYVLAGTLVAIVLASLAIEMRAVMTARVPIVEPRTHERHESS